jgi:hypothetical protein
MTQQPTLVELIKLGVGNAGLGNKCALIIKFISMQMALFNLGNAETNARCNHQIKIVARLTVILG